MTASTARPAPTPRFVNDRSILLAALAGAVAGVSVWLVTRLIDRFVTQPLLCPKDVTLCDQSTATAFTLATIAVSLLTLPFLVRARVYRPLLVVIAVAVALWGVQAFLQYLRWYEAALWLGLCSALAYAACAWLAKTHRFMWALIGLTVAVVAIRVLLFLI